MQYGRRRFQHRDDLPVELYARQVQFIGLLHLELPGYSLNWTLRQDMRDPRRFAALDLGGILHGHAAPKELLRQTALIVPTYMA